MYDTPVGKPYKDLYQLLKEKPYFILTTNVDMQLDKQFTADHICHFQGDMRYRQCQQPCNDEVWENDDIVKALDGLDTPTVLPSDLVPRCPDLCVVIKGLRNVNDVWRASIVPPFDI